MNVSLPLRLPIPSNLTVPLHLTSSPLIYVDPTTARWINFSVYLHVASSGILIWDFLNNLRNDYKLLTNHKMGIPTILYFTLRLSLLAYSFGRGALLTLPIADCGKLVHALNAFLTICVASATTFFYLRMVAVYKQNRYVTGCFGVLWLGTIAMAILFTQTFGAEHIEPTLYCRETIDSSFLLPIITFIWANDLLIYFAIAYRIYRIFADHDFEANLQRRLAILLFGASLPVGSKIVLLESQLSCLMIVMSKFFLVVGLAIDESRWYMFIICHLVIMAILTSRMYRELRGVTSDSSIKPNATDFRTANLTSAEFRNATVERAMRAGNLSETKSTALDLDLDETLSRSTSGEMSPNPRQDMTTLSTPAKQFDGLRKDASNANDGPRRYRSQPHFITRRQSDIGVPQESKWM